MNSSNFCFRIFGFGRKRHDGGGASVALQHHRPLQYVEKPKGPTGLLRPVTVAVLWLDNRCSGEECSERSILGYNVARNIRNMSKSFKITLITGSNIWTLFYRIRPQPHIMPCPTAVKLEVAHSVFLFFLVDFNGKITLFKTHFWSKQKHEYRKMNYTNYDTVIWLL